MTREGSLCICLLVIIIDYILQNGKNYYSLVILENNANKFSQQKMVKKYINDELEYTSDDSDEEVSYETDIKSSDGKISDEYQIIYKLLCQTCRI